MKDAANDLGSAVNSEQQVRTDLAACHRLAYHYGWDDIVWNHITARLPDQPDQFLLKLHDLRYDEITASNLVRVDADGNVVSGPDDINVTGFVIHSAVYSGRREINCVLHTHTQAGIAVSCLDAPLIPMANDAMMWIDNIGYHDYEGLSDDADECRRLVASLGDNSALILRNHGLLTVGRSVAEAFVMMYYLDRACQVHLDVLQTGQAYRLPPRDVQEKASKQYRKFWPGDSEWPALVRLADKLDPSYRD